MAQELLTPPTKVSEPRPRRQPLPRNAARPPAEHLLREMAFVLRATRMVRESLAVRS